MKNMLPVPPWRPAVVADRLRVAAECRRAGDLYEALAQVLYARSNRLLGLDSAFSTLPTLRPRGADDLTRRLWSRHCRDHHYW